MNLTRVYGIMLRHIFLTIHQLERFADMFLFPVFGLVLWGFLANYVQIQSSQLAAFFMGGLILWVIFERVSTAVGVDFMFDVWERNIMNILASPITLLEYISGLVVVSIVKVLVSLSAMLIIAAIFYNFSIGALGIWLVLFWFNLVLFAVSLGIFSIALVLRWGHTIGPLTWILPFAIQPFSGVFYPVSVLPELAQRIVWFLPLPHVFEGMRHTMSTGKFDFGEFLVGFGLNLVYFVLVVLFFAYMFDLVKKKGTLVKL
ncbi:MAG: ABC transporter permease [Candidatus Curtissbacteria bacterium]|nr:ABC transporter permease [Candidatus Curtissbacteria bacterium]